MTRLSALLAEVPGATWHGEDREVDSIAYDSRKAGPSTLFVCLPGSRVDGHEFIADCYERGVRAFVVSRPGLAARFPEATLVEVPDARQALALASAAFFDHPTRRLTMIGITGTKGKTSVSFLLQRIFEQAGRDAAVIGTTGVAFRGELRPTANTTPESYELQRTIADLDGADAVIMEVSSQGLMHHRTDGIQFDVGVFLNISEDHIGPDEHASFEEYAHFKSLLFTQCDRAVINADAERARMMIDTFAGAREAAGQQPRLVLFGLSAGDTRAWSLRPERSGGRLGISFDCTGADHRLTVAMPGRFSVYNALAAICTARMLGIAEQDIASGLADAVVVGRGEPVSVPAPYTVIVDYAHNAMSMDSLLATLAEYQPHRIIVVFGAGGNRAHSRRAEVGEAVARHGAFAVITSDNPRDEELADILAEIEAGVAAAGGEYEVVPDRTQAVHRALSIAEAGDIVVIAGKGHQRYEEIKGKRYPYDDREAVRSYFA